MTDLPAPLTPPDCDLRDFQFMPLEVARVRRSKQWLLAKRDPEIGFYSINLWMMAWHEVPSGSLEDDDDVLADAAMCDPRKWPKIRDRVLRGWVKCADGRLYHSVVAEKALDSWSRKKAQRQRTEAARSARHAARQAGSKSATIDATVSVTEDVTEQSQAPRDRDRDRKKDTELRSGAPAAPPPPAGDLLSVADPPEPAAPPAPPTMRETLFRDGVPVIRALLGKSDRQARAMLGSLLKATCDDCARVYGLIREAESLRPADPQAWLYGAARARAGPAQQVGKFDWLFNGACDSTTTIDGEAA